MSVEKTSHESQPNTDEQSKQEPQPKESFRDSINRKFLKLSYRLNDNLGFLNNSNLRLIIVILLFGFSFLFSYLAFKNQILGFSAIVAIILAFSFIIFLILDSFFFVNSILYASLGKRLDIITGLDKKLKTTIKTAEEDCSNPEGETPEFYAEEFFSEFKNLRPLPKLTRKILFRSICNFFLTAMCFGFISMNLVRLHIYYCGTATLSPYKHSCFEGKGFAETWIHFLYYHLVIFQSLGDGNHSPETTDAQIIAILETFIALFYTILILGGVFSVATFVQSELTPEKLRDDFRNRLVSISPTNKTSGQSGINEEGQS